MSVVDIDREIIRQEKREIFLREMKKSGSVIATGGVTEFNHISKLDKSRNIVVSLDVETDALRQYEVWQS